jgi:signal transduction histidine kinase
VLETTALGAAVLGMSLLVFAWLPASEAGRFVQACVLVPLLMWGALGFGTKGATVTVFLTSAIAVWATVLGKGPFVQATLPQSLLFLQAFMAITATAVFVVGAVVADRARVYEAERASRLRAEAAEQEAKRLVAIQERLVAVVSHDLRNPLGAIMAGIGLLRRRRGRGAESWEEAVLERQAHSAARMEEIIRNVLTFAKARTEGTITVSAGSVHLGDVCRQVIAESEQAEPGRTVSLRVEGNDSGEWDAARMAQVMSNLVGNAVQHSPQGTSVDVRIRGSPRNVVVQVHNAGPPIPPDVLPRIFEPFEQGIVQGAGVNVGLGLYIVKQIVEAHEGTVDVCSREGKGTSFVVKLPRSLHGVDA